MKWLEVHIDTNHAGLEPLEIFLSAQGIDSLVIDDETEFQDFLEQNRQCWDYVDDDLLAQKRGRSRITFYLEENDAGISTLARIRTALVPFKQEHPNCGSLLMTLDGLEEADWENNWKQYYKPLEVGRRLIIVPAWEQADCKGRVPLILNPGLTFGTGSHATTQLCLTALEDCIQPGGRVLDLGCGSGILSIAALKLGASQAFACDIDPQCQHVVWDNAALNGIDRDAYTVRTGDVLNSQKLRDAIGSGYDIILANIVADVIIALAPIAGQFLKPQGVLICSGIIDTRVEETRQALQDAGWRIRSSAHANDWYQFTCTRT